MQLVFRKCVPADLEFLVQISKTTFIEAFKEQNDPEDFQAYVDAAFEASKLQGELSNTKSAFYFVYWCDSIIGYFKLNWENAQTDLKGANGIELERIYVVKEYQSKGFGKNILDKVKKLATATAKAFLWLGVWEHNKRAIGFYKKNGFSKFGTHPYYIGTDKQTDWLMRYDLLTFNED